MNGALLLALLLWTPPEEGRGVVIVPVANLYSAASEEVEVVSQAICGTNVTILEEEKSWAKVKTPDEYTGWTPSVSLRRLRPGEPPYASQGRLIEVDSLYANLYRDPDVTKRRPLLTVPFETRLEVLAEPDGEQGRWIQVRLPDERAAWVQRGDVRFDLRPLTVTETIALAKRFLGVPYLWGGTSSFGYDCSGFTQMLMRRRGVPMPRDSHLQFAWSGLRRVRRASLRPGDLLFFGTSAQRITHTGMYIGRGVFIHATTHGRPGVQLSKLREQPWARLLVACRRLK